MSSMTPALQALSDLAVPFQVHHYDYQADSVTKGLQAACALGLSPERVCKTLMTWVDDQAVCAVIPSHHRLLLKQLAYVCQGKNAKLMPAADAERLTGYRIGGISPVGQRKPAPIVIDASVLSAPTIWFNAGRRGLLVEVVPAQAISAFGAKAWAISQIVGEPTTMVRSDSKRIDRCRNASPFG